MSEKSDANPLSTYKWKWQKDNAAEATRALKKQCVENPDSAFFANHLLGNLGSGASSQAVDLEGPWPQAYGLLKKYPKTLRNKILYKATPDLTETQVKMLRVLDKNIDDKLFQFQFGVDLNYTWPQGACHKCGYIDKVLLAWLQHIGGDRLKKFFDFQCTHSCDWNAHSVYEPLPLEEDLKTHIRHKPSGAEKEIPSSMRVTSSWTIVDNSSEHAAILQDPDGYGRKVAAFFPLEQLSLQSWVEFAAKKAQNLEAEEDAPQELRVQALGIVARGLQLEGMPTP